jgi:CRISPR/Cas system-associated exonuclease Cas4 (RecB family)
MLQIRRFDFTPILGWSVSRYDTFSDCKREYYYQYYGKFDPDFDRARIEALKRLTSIPLEIGHVTHQTVAAILRRLLKSDAPLDLPRFDEFVQRQVEVACKTHPFFETHYALSEAVRPEDLLPAVRECLSAFLGSSRFEWITRQAAAHRDQWVIEPPGYGEARVDGMKVYCKVDFLFGVDGRVVILDWKTGRADAVKHRKQMLGYAVWAIHHVQAPAAAIDAVTAYLRPAYTEISLTPTDDELRQLVLQIRDETREMHAFCSDVEQNTPLAKTAFPMADDPRACRLCNFRELCGRS